MFGVHVDVRFIVTSPPRCWRDAPARGILCFVFGCALHSLAYHAQNSSTVVMPCRTSRQPSSASVFHAGAPAASRIWSLDAFFKTNWRFRCRCPSTQKSRAGHGSRCCGIRGSRRICKCDPGGNAQRALKAWAVGESSICLQCLQSTRTRRWASTASSDDATRYGSTPCHEAGDCARASLVCRVEKTRWPVREAWTASAPFPGRGFRR